jgi:universal stress protein A
VFVLNRILVPTNHGEPSKAAIKYGVAFARQFNAQLFLVHVLSEKDFDFAIEAERAVETLMPEAVLDAAPDSPVAVARNAAHEDLGQLLDPEDERATRAQYVLRAGRSGPGDGIVACATELEVELIVMGKHRLGFVEHLLAGSVTEKVVRHAPCPVLIVQHPEHEFVVPEGRSRI